MLTVQTYLAPSNIHGIGLFAAEDLPRGTVIWRFNPNIDKVITRKKFIRMCREVDFCTLKHLLNATYKRRGKFFYITDNARFINHSEEGCNVALIDDHTEISIRDIRAAEELLENYNASYDANDFFFLECMQNQNQYVEWMETLGRCAPETVSFRPCGGFAKATGR